MRQFERYTDSDCGFLPSCKSTSDSALFYKGCVIAWKSRTQRIVSMSTTEAETIALVEAFKEQKGFHKLFKESGYAKEPRKVHGNNQQCMLIAQDICYSGRGEHIEQRFLAIQVFVNEGQSIKLVCCP